VSSTLIFDPVGEVASGCEPAMRLNLSIKIPLHQLVDALIGFHGGIAGCDVVSDPGSEPPKGIDVATCSDIAFGLETMMRLEPLISALTDTHRLSRAPEPRYRQGCHVSMSRFPRFLQRMGCSIPLWVSL